MVGAVVETAVPPHLTLIHLHFKLLIKKIQDFLKSQQEGIKLGGLKTNSKATSDGFSGGGNPPLLNSLEEDGIENIRDYFTTGETGYSQMLIDDYQKRVNNEIMRISKMNVVLRDKNGRKLSIRNLAEMQVRFDELQKDCKRLQDRGINYVIATSHNNASERCQPWQGKIFMLDAAVGEVAIKKEIYKGEPKPIGKTPDGKDYYSLKEAMSYGFLGYNCRHRVIEYKPGMIVPKHYPNRQIELEREKEEHIRQMERLIREKKRQALLTTDKNERKKFQEESKKLEDDYWKYCKDHNYPVAEWRTRVSKEEREGLKSGDIKFNAEGEETNQFYMSEEVKRDLKRESDEKHKNATDIEPTLTKDLTDIAKQQGVKLEGLEFRLKTKESLERKVMSDYSEVRTELERKGIKVTYENSIKKTVDKIHDVNRYTMILDPDNFTETYQKVQEALEQNGYEVYKVKNTFKSKDATYRGINNQYIKNGQIFELQFHTEESFNLKNGELHKLYEEFRLDTTTPERKKELSDEMKRLSNQIKIPKDVEKI